MLICLFISFVATVLSFTYQAPFAMWLKELAQPAHEICLGLVPASKHAALYAAMVCGERLPSTEFKQQLISLGVIHLLVVSGSHLIFLEQLAKNLTERFQSGRSAVFIILVLFTLSASLQAPAVRALIAWTLNGLNRRLQLCWTPLQLITIAGAMSLPFAVALDQVFSLQLSWAAALGLAAWSSNGKNGFTQLLAQNSAVFVLMVPLMLTLTLPHPFSILVNVAIGSLVGTILFPVSLAVLMLSKHISAVTTLGDAAWRGFAWGVERISSFAPSPWLERAPLIAPPTYVVYLWFLTLAMMLREKQQRQAFDDQV